MAIVRVGHLLTKPSDRNARKPGRARQSAAGTKHHLAHHHHRLPRGATIFPAMAIVRARTMNGVVLTFVVNNSTTWTRQIFTLFHELAHLLHHHHGVTRADLDFKASLPPADATVEVACNRFAAEFLLPRTDFDPQAATFTGDVREVEAAAAHYNISREVVLRRLRDLGRLSQETYDAWTRDWTQAHFARPKPARAGGNYYATRVAYLGEPFLSLAFTAYERGRIQLPELAAHLGVKGPSIPKLVACN